MKRTLRFLLLVVAVLTMASSQAPPHYEVAVLKYRGGGDWYANPTALTNLISYCSDNLNIRIKPDYQVVEAGSPDILNYPFVHMTGHGNVEWNSQERDNLRTWLLGGGLLHIDDNYGMDKFIRGQLEQLLPEYPLTEIAADHIIFEQPYRLQEGLPKVHEHDGSTPQAFGIFIEGRLAVFYSFESDLGDGWEDPEVHNDPADIREKALQMGANLISYAFNGPIHVQDN